MKKLAMSGVILATALTLSIQVQAGIRDYSRSTIGQGNLIHESVEKDSMRYKETETKAKETHANAPVLWEWDDIDFR